MSIGYKNKAGKNLLELLRNISKNHCMYCYALLKSDRVDTGNLEHSIEKKLDEEHLEECVQNIALAGVRGKYGSKIEIRYNGPDLCV